MINDQPAQPVILCALEVSPGNDHVLRWAASAAQRWRCPLHLLTVVHTAEEGVVRLAQQRVAEVVSSLAARDVRAIGQVLIGEPHLQIATYADQTQSLLIVMGGSRKSALGRLLLGSVADRTLRTATRPVVFVSPDGAPDGPLRLEQPSARLRVLVGLDASAGSEAALVFVRELRRTIACDLTFVHLYWPIEEIDRLGLRGPRDFTAPDSDVVANLEPGLRRRIGVLPGTGEVRLQIRSAWGAPSENLELAAEQASFDLMIVGAQTRHGLQRLWHPSAAGALVHHGHRLPVVCVPSAYGGARPESIPSIATVLAATDFSSVGDAAVIHAYSLVRQHGGVVELCHVHEHHLPAPPFVHEQLSVTLTADQRQLLEEELRALIPATAADYGITTHVSVIDGGQAAQAITQVAERLHVDVICLGSHGRGALASAVTGSVARGVLERAHVPVMMARAPRAG